jgi:hypothetical protein
LFYKYPSPKTDRSAWIVSASSTLILPSDSTQAIAICTIFFRVASSVFARRDEKGAVDV